MSKVLGPVVVNYMRDYQPGLGLPRAQVYNQTTRVQRPRIEAPTMFVVLAWLSVGIPLAWGIYKTAISVAKLFN